jgi:hypothetical protein
MSIGERPVSISVNPSFDAVVDEACGRLMDRQIQYSIKRIYEMEDVLNMLEQELDEFLQAKTWKPAG